MASHLSPNLTHPALPYHEVSALRLHLVTTSGLVAAGIPADALGSRRGKKQVISSCFKFSDFARELMPAFLGGTREGTASRIGPISSDFVSNVGASCSVSAFEQCPSLTFTPTFALLDGDFTFPPAAPVHTLVAPVQNLAAPVHTLVAPVENLPHAQEEIPRDLTGSISAVHMTSPGRRRDTHPSSSYPSGLAPKNQQQHMMAARANDHARAAAVATLVGGVTVWPHR